MAFRGIYHGDNSTLNILQYPARTVEESSNEYRRSHAQFLMKNIRAPSQTSLTRWQSLHRAYLSMPALLVIRTALPMTLRQTMVKTAISAEASSRSK